MLTQPQFEKLSLDLKTQPRFEKLGLGLKMTLTFLTNTDQIPNEKDTESLFKELICQHKNYDFLTSWKLIFDLK